MSEKPFSLCRNISDDFLCNAELYALWKKEMVQNFSIRVDKFVELLKLLFIGNAYECSKVAGVWKFILSRNIDSLI